MHRCVIACALLVLAGGPGRAEDAVSILRGTLADALAERAGDGGVRRLAAQAPIEPVADDLATLTEGQIAGGSDPRARSPGIPAREVSSVSDEEGRNASLTLRAGYDSNYDELVQPEGSRFVELSGELATTGRAGDTDLFLSASGTALALPDLDLSERFGGEITAGARREVADGLFLSGAAGIGLDGYDDPVTAEPAAAVSLQFIRPFAAAALRASVDAEETILTRLEENEDDDGADDFQRASVDTTVILAPQAMLAPIVSGRISRIRFSRPTALSADTGDEAGDEAGDDAADGGDPADPTAEDETDDGEDIGPDEDVAELRAGTAMLGGDAPINRDATDMTLAAGLRLRPVESLLISTSVRLNRRDFDQPGAEPYTNAAPDIEITWSLTDEAELTLAATRIIGQPDEDGSLAQDVRSYAAEFSYEPETGFGFAASGGFSQIREIGVEARSTESFGEVTLSYKPTTSLLLQASLLQSWTNDLTFDEDTESTQISGGVRAAF